MYLVRTCVVVRQLKQVNVIHGKEVLLQLLCHSITRECATLLMQRILSACINTSSGSQQYSATALLTTLCANSFPVIFSLTFNIPNN